MTMLMCTHGQAVPPLTWVVMQWEVSNRALEVLQDTKDAAGRTIEVCKIRLPPPLFRTYKEAEGLAVRVAPVTSIPWHDCKLYKQWLVPRMAALHLQLALSSLRTALSRSTECLSG